MRGLELSERFFFECGLPLLRKHYPELSRHLAAGLISRGSDVCGFDDAISQDHAWGPRFIVFLRPSDFEISGGAVDRLLLRQLPKEFCGACLREISGEVASRNAWVTTPEESCRYNTGLPGPPATEEEWLTIPENCLFEFTQGRVFYEPEPLITPLREEFAYFPEMVWRKRLSFAWLQMAHTVNLHRVARREDHFAVHSFLCWGLECSIRIVHLLNRRYAPVRKWLYRSLLSLPELPEHFTARVEDLLRLSDPIAIESGFLRLLGGLARMTNDSGLISPQPLEPGNTSANHLPFNFMGFAEAFWATLSDSLRSLPIEVGPLDQTGVCYAPVGSQPIAEAFW